MSTDTPAQPDARTLAERIDTFLNSPSAADQDALAASRTEAPAAGTPLAEALAKWLSEFTGGAGHTRVFLTSREKMHPTGIDLWDESVAKAKDLLRALASEAAPPIVVQPQEGATTADYSTSRITMLASEAGPRPVGPSLATELSHEPPPDIVDEVRRLAAARRKETPHA